MTTIRTELPAHWHLRYIVRDIAMLGWIARDGTPQANAHYLNEIKGHCEVYLAMQGRTVSAIPVALTSDHAPDVLPQLQLAGDELRKVVGIRTSDHLSADPLAGKSEASLMRVNSLVTQIQQLCQQQLARWPQGIPTPSKGRG
ncbi:MAG: hypothetical protein K2Q12_02075 [Rickettsiales bacterium]|nr:hypothetical protein [Rickettsiales bacterium]